jgi:hypothetical protein
MAAPNYDLLARQNGGMNLDSLATAAGGAALPDTIQGPQAPMGGAAYSGLPDEGLQRPLMDPAGGGSLQQGLLDAITTLGGGYELARAGIPALARMGGSLLDRISPEMISAAAKDTGPVGLGVRLANATRGVAPKAAQAIASKLGVPVEQAAEHMAEPLAAGEAQLFRKGGMAEVVRERIAKAAEGVAPAVAEAPSQAARVAGGAERVSKDAMDYARRRGFAILKQAGLPNDAESFSNILGRKIGSRADLTADDWVKVWDHATEKIAQDAADAAAQKAAVKAAKTGAQKAAATTERAAFRPRGAAAPAAAPTPGVPNRGLAPSSEVPPGFLQRLADMNLTPQQLHDFWTTFAQGGAQ